MIIKAEEIILDLPETSIAALAWGPTSGKPILALHGWLDNAASFIPIAAHLQGFRLIAIDLPGHGLSSHKPIGCYFHFIDYVADVIAVLDYLQWQKPSILGHSLGAGIGSMVAAIFPDRIESLGLIDGIGTPSITESNMPAMMRDSIFQHTKLKRKKLSIHANKQEAINARLHASKMLPESVNLLVTRGLKAVDGGFCWRTDPRLLLPPLTMFTEQQNLQFLSKVTSQTCMIKSKFGWPCDENIFTASVAELGNNYNVFTGRVSQLSNVEVHEIEGHHHMHMDQPELVGPVLNDFFNRVLK